MRLTRRITLLLCLCALALRAGGAHVHIALDHEDVHTEDRQNHVHLVVPDLHKELHPDHDHDNNGHDDAISDQQQHVQVNLDGQVLSKKPSFDLGIENLLFAAALILFLLAPRKLIRSSIHLFTPLLQRLIHLRPPLRGPPLHA